IVAAMRLKLAGKDTAAAHADAGTADPVAHDLVLQGLYALNLRTEAGLRSAETMIDQAIARDPNYARAYAARASVFWYIAYRRYGPVVENYRKAQESARRALELDPGSAEAEVVLG